MKHVKKSDLPEKNCIVCKKNFTWRKKMGKTKRYDEKGEYVRLWLGK